MRLWSFFIISGIPMGMAAISCYSIMPAVKLSRAHFQAGESREFREGVIRFIRWLQFLLMSCE